jgi:hypothetical protein
MANEMQPVWEFEDRLLADIIEKEKLRPAPTKYEKASVPSKPKRVGSKTWDYTRARYIGGDR